MPVGLGMPKRFETQTLHCTCGAGQRVQKILDAVTAAGVEHRRRITTATINMVVRETLNWRSPPTLRGSSKKGRIYYATQVDLLCFTMYD